ncbi:MAG: hypothetical protein JXR64_05750 [Spirochaetales bacterium]|nr:hypothetical protein [Spirochaetales bacterium]
MDVYETSSIEYPLIPKRIKSLKITYKGLDLTISGETPVLIKSDDNIRRTSKVVSIKIDEQSVNLHLENNTILNIKVDNYGDRLTITSTIPKVFPKIKEIEIPFTLIKDFTMSNGELSYIIKSGKDEFHLKYNDNYTVNRSNNHIILYAEDDNLSNLTFSPLNSSDLPIAEQWYMKYRKPEQKLTDELINNFIDNISTSISQIFKFIEYNSDSGTWKNLPSRDKYTQDSVIVYLAEAMSKGNYSSSLIKINGLKSLYPSDFGFKSMPFLGNIVQNGSKEHLNQKRELENIERIVKYSTSELLNLWIPEHYFPGNQIDLIKLQEDLVTLSVKDLTLEQKAIYLNNLLGIIQYGKPTEGTFNSVKIASDFIINQIKWDETGLYLVENDISNQRLNLDIAKILLKAAQHETSEYTKPVAEALISTYIRNSDRSSSVSLTYNIKDKIFSKEKITPEESYLKLSTNKHIPHYYQDYGVKVWTISDSVQIQQTPNSTRISITYPVDSKTNINSHFLYISGIKPYAQLYFKGKPWRADVNFEKWNVGYYYDQTSQMLYFLPNHTNIREEILVTY